MARVKRGVTSRAKHKKVLKAVKGQWVEEKIPLGSKQAMEKLCNMLTEIEEIKKENLNLYGYKESTQELEQKD